MEGKIQLLCSKKEIMRRWIMQIRRFRQKLITRFGFRLWRDVSLNELEESVANWDVKCTNLEDVTAFANKLSEEHKLSEDVLPYQFCFIEDYCIPRWLVPLNDQQFSQIREGD